MEKWAAKWLEMHSQRHRFKKKIRGRPPDPPPPMNDQPPLILSPRARLASLRAPSNERRLPSLSYSPLSLISLKDAMRLYAPFERLAFDLLFRIHIL